MKTFSRKQLSEAAESGEGFCIRCGLQQDLVQDSPEGLGLCDECGAKAVIPAETVLQVASLIEEEG